MTTKMPTVPDGGWVLVNGSGGITGPDGKMKPYAGAWGYGRTVKAAKDAAYRGGRIQLRFGYQVLVFGPDSEFGGVDVLGYYYTGPGPVADVTIPPR